MAKLTLSEAARAYNVARTTIQRAVKTGRVSLDAEHRVDTAELLRVGYQLDAAALHAASQQTTADTQQDAAPQRSSTQQGAAPQELQLLRQERDALQRERDLLMQQVTMLHTMHQTTQQQLTQAQQMLHEMQHRYDRQGADRRRHAQGSHPARHIQTESMPSGGAPGQAAAGDTDQSVDGGVRDLQGDGVSVSGTAAGKVNDQKPVVHKRPITHGRTGYRGRRSEGVQKPVA